MTTTDQTITPTFPGPDDACPDWCTESDDKCHTWEPCAGGWTRLHSHNLGLFTVMQFEKAAADGRTFDAPTGETCLDTFDTAQDARDIAADLETVARLMDQIESTR